MNDNWPIIQCPPGPTDAELEAERDTKHRRAVAEWFRMEWLMAGLTAGAVAIAVAPSAGAVPVVGGGGLTPNAWAVVNYVQANFPGVQSIGGVRACDWIGEHCSGRAVDIMVGGNTALGNAVNSSVRGLAGVKYTLWQVTHHYDHVHVSVY